VLVSGEIQSQTVDLTENEQMIFQAANDSLDAGNYQFAFEKYSQLLSIYNQESIFRYKYAVCLIHLNRNLEQAIEYLNIAANTSDIPQIDFYLGMAYHLRYMFDKALNYYYRFQNADIAAKIKDELPLERQIAMAQNGKKLVEYAYRLDVIETKNLTLQDFYYSYRLEDIGGEFVKKHPDLQTRFDRKHEKHPIMFRSIVQDVILFSSFGKNGSTGKDIYILRRNDKGEWADPEKLDEIINSNEDEDFPYLHPSGNVLFFCSKGHNSMGGYDIFVSEWNESTNQWGIPINMDFPINSPLDDILYVNDAENNYAYFASGRNSEDERVDIYKILVEKERDKRKVENLEDVINTSKLEVNFVAQNLEKRDANALENDENLNIKEEEETQLKIFENKEELPENRDYLAMIDRVSQNLEEIEIITEDLVQDRNRIKNMLREALMSEDTIAAITAYQAVGEYEKVIELIQNDVTSFKETLTNNPQDEENLPSKQIQEEMTIVQNNSNEIISNYSDYLPTKAWDDKIQEIQAEIIDLSNQVEEVRTALEQNLKKTEIDLYNSESIKQHETLVEQQQELLNTLSDLEYTQYKKEQLLDRKKKEQSELEQMTEKLSVTSTLDTEIVETDVRALEKSFIEQSIVELKEKQIEVHKTNKQTYQILKWDEQSQIKDSIKDMLVLAETLPDFSQSDISQYSDSVKQVIAESESAAKRVQQINEKIKTANPEDKAQLWEEMQQDVMQLKENQQFIAGLERNETEKTQNNQSVDVELVTQTETEYYEEDLFISASEQREFEEIIETENNILNEEAKTIQSQTIELTQKLNEPVNFSEQTQVGDNVEYIKSQQNSIIAETIDLQKQAIENLKSTNYVLKDNLIHFTEASQGFTVIIRPSIIEAENLMEEGESFEIAARNTTNPIRKIEFLEQAAEKNRQAKEKFISILDSIDTNLAEKFNEEISVPSIQSIKTAFAKDVDVLTELKHNEAFVENQENLISNSAARNREIAKRETMFESTDSLFSVRELIVAQVMNDDSNQEKSELFREQDALRFEIAEDVISVYQQAEPAIRQRIEENKESLEYLNQIGLINSNDLSEISYEADILAEQPIIIEFATPIQIHQTVSLLSEKMNTQLDIIRQQESKINAVRNESRSSLPPDWYDLENKMQRLAEPSISMDYNFDDFGQTAMPELSDESVGEYKKVSELIEKSKAKQAEIKIEIEQIYASDLSDKKTNRSLDKLGNNLLEETVKALQLEVSQQNIIHDNYLAINELINDKAAAEMKSISDSLVMLAESISADIANNDVSLLKQKEQLQYASGLMREANFLQQEIADKSVSKDENLALIQVYRPEYQDEEILAISETDIQETDNIIDKVKSEESFTEDLISDEENDFAKIEETENTISESENLEELEENLTNISEDIGIKDEETLSMVSDSIVIESDTIKQDIVVDNQAIDDDKLSEDLSINDDEVIAKTEMEESENYPIDLSDDTQTEQADTVSTNELSMNEYQPVDIIDDEQNTVEEVLNQDEREPNEILEESVINNQNLEHNPENADTFFYRIQIVAYSRPLNDTVFRGISPMVDERVANTEIYRYLCGKFYNTASWQSVLPQLRSSGYPDAFVVAYHNSQRLSLSAAADLQYLEQDLPPEFSMFTEATPVIAASVNSDLNQNTQEETLISGNNFQLQQGLSPVPRLESATEQFFSVQIGAFGKLLSQEEISNIKANFYTQLPGGLYKYYHGKFNEYQNALLAKREINQRIPDAFVVKFDGFQTLSNAETTIREQDNNDNNIVEESVPEINDKIGIQFKIQIGAFRDVMSSTILSAYQRQFAPYAIGSINSGSFRIYYIEGFDDYSEAERVLNQIVRPVISDAFMTAWRGNQKMSIQEARIEMQ
jgi:hypothetical protein